MASFYKEWCWRQVDSGHLLFTEKLSMAMFRYAWYSFLQLLDINPTSGFRCHLCGDIPDTVVMDGVTLGLRKALVDWSAIAPSEPAKLDGR